MIRTRIYTLFFALALHLSHSSYCTIPTYSDKDHRGTPLDHLLIDILNIKNGTFIEVGAFDGLRFSNTKLLEELCGWTGILIEPSENLFQKLRDNRPTARCFQCALGTFEQHATYAYGDFDGHLMSSLTGRRDVKENPQAYKVLV